MFTRLLLSVAVLAGSAPVFAATTATWYLAQNVKTKNCIVTPTKPNGTTYTMVGTDTFKTAAAGIKVMDAAADCLTKPKATTVSTKPTTTAKPGSSVAKTSPPTTGRY